MDLSVIGSIFTLPFIIFIIMIYLATRVFRYVIEFIAKRFVWFSHVIVKILKKIKIIESKVAPEKVDATFFWFWRENLLPGSPLFFGGLMAYLIKDYPYPDQFKETVTARVFAGIFAGLVCVFLYPRFTFYMKKFANKKLDEAEEKVKSQTEDSNNSEEK